MSSIYGRLPVSGHYVEKRLRSPGAARRVAGFSIVLMAAAVALYRLGSIQSETLVGVFLLSTTLAFVCFAVCLLALVRCGFFGIVGGGAALGGLVLSFLALAPFLVLAYLGATSPPTNVAYTEGMAPDEIATALAGAGSGPASRSGGVAAAVADLPSVVPSHRYPVDAPRVFEASRTVLADLGWTVKDVVVGDPAQEGSGPDDLGVSGSVDVPIPTFRADALSAPSDEPSAIPEAERYSIDVVARDRIVALPSDMTVRLVEDGNETFVDLQSMSLATELDFGENRRLIDRFLQALDAALIGTGPETQD